MYPQVVLSRSSRDAYEAEDHVAVHRGRSGLALRRFTDAIRKRMQHGAIKMVVQDGTRYLLLDESETRHTTDADSGRYAECSVLISRPEASSVVSTPVLRRADNPLLF